MPRDELPLGWANRTLDQVIASNGLFVDGDWVESKDQDPSGSVRLIQLADIGDGTFRDKSARFLTQSKALELRCTFLKQGDLLVARMPDPLGRCCIFPLEEDKKYVTVVDVCIIRLGQSSVDSKYMLYLLNSPSVRADIASLQSGSTRKRISRKNLSTVSIRLAPLNEQRRIVAKIEELFSELDKGVESLQTAREQLKVYRQAVLKHAFEGKLTAKWREENKDKLETGAKLAALHRKMEPVSTGESRHLASLPSGWSYVPLGDYIAGIEAGKSFKCDERQPSLEEIGVAKVSAVSWGVYNEAESKTCIDASKVNPQLFIKPGDFLLSRANTIELVGACVIAKKVTQRIMLSDKTLRLSFDAGVQDYALHYLRSQAGRNEIMERSTGNQESMRNIGQDRIRNIMFPVCHELEIAQVVQLLEATLGHIEAIDVSIAEELLRSQALRQSILKRAFSGQLVPQDPNDEPASVLLERIRNEKAGQAKTGKKSQTLEPV